MTPLHCYLICAAFVCGSLYLLRRKTPFASRRSENYVSRRHTIRLLGVLLLFPALVALAMGYVLKNNLDRLPQTSAQPGDSVEAVEPVKKIKPAKVEKPAPDPAAEAKKQKMLDDALAKVNVRLLGHPRDFIAYGDRGNIYAAKQQWKEAEDDYRTALMINPKLAKASFNLAEMDFRQKNYDDARPAFLALVKDRNLGDLSAFKVFLCDLLGGHATDANRELDVFNQAGTNASYYFANAAWFIFHGKPDQARDFLQSANHIYEPYKVALYTSTLTDLGYLPLPEPTDE